MDVFEKGNFYKIPDDEFSNFLVAVPSAIGAGLLLKKKKKKKEQKQQAELEAKQSLTQATAPAPQPKAENEDLGLTIKTEQVNTPIKQTSGVDSAPLKTEDLSVPAKKNNTLLYVGIGAVVLIGGYFLFKKK